MCLIVLSIREYSESDDRCYERRDVFARVSGVTVFYLISSPFLRPARSRNALRFAFETRARTHGARKCNAEADARRIKTERASGARSAIRRRCAPSWALLGKCDGVLRARLHPNENYPFAVRLTWPGAARVERACGRARVSTLSQPTPARVELGRPGPPVCAYGACLRASNFVSTAMHGKEGRWTENCFMLRF